MTRHGDVPAAEPLADLIARSETLAVERERWIDEQILQALRDVARTLGECTSDSYQLAWDSGWDIPTRTTVEHRFGGWSNALIAAQLPNRGPSRHNKNRMPDEHLWAEVRRCAAELGCVPSVKQYDRWARACGAPCQALVRRRLGGWREVLRELGGQS